VEYSFLPERIDTRDCKNLIGFCGFLFPSSFITKWWWSGVPLGQGRESLNVRFSGIPQSALIFDRRFANAFLPNSSSFLFLHFFSFLPSISSGRRVCGSFCPRFRRLNSPSTAFSTFVPFFPRKWNFYFLPLPPYGKRRRSAFSPPLAFPSGTASSKTVREEENSAGFAFFSCPLEGDVFAICDNAKRQHSFFLFFATSTFSAA